MEQDLLTGVRRVSIRTTLVSVIEKARYSVVIDDMITTAWFKEPSGASDDPFKESSVKES